MLFREFDRKEYEYYFNTKIKNLELDAKEKSAQLQEQSEILQEQKSQLEDKDALLKEQAMLIEKYKNMLNANGIMQ